ncbi:MAG TPA: tetratricopeptide repeat protein [Polyangia bacterium]
MNTDERLSEKLLRVIAANQDARLAEMPRDSDAIAEQSMHRAWPPSRRSRLVPYLAVVSVAAAVAFVVALASVRWNRKVLHFEVAGRVGQMGASVTAQEGVALPLRFSDGSVVVFQPGAQARVARLTDNGAELLLDSGRLELDVEHTGVARWSVVAGPFTVRVTGTRFEAEWSPHDRRLSVQMIEGSVVVEGPSLGRGLALRGGEQLKVGVDSPPVVTRTGHAATTIEQVPAAQAAVPDLGTPSASERIPGPLARPHASWFELSESGRYVDAVAAAEREGFPLLCRQLDADSLLALGDAARYASSPERARQAFVSLVKRFPRDQRSYDALFALGRLESEVGDPAVAARWFERYLSVARHQPLEEEAAGRLMEIYSRTGDREDAVRVARDYLDHYPDGLRAGLARKVLAFPDSTEARP